MLCIILSVLLGTLMNLTAQSEANIVQLEDVPCDIHPTPIETSTTVRDFYPGSVMLHRCEGTAAIGSPLICSVDTQEKLDVIVYKLPDMIPLTITMFNHTRCLQICPSGPESCNKHQLWLPHHCRCVCQKPTSPPCNDRQRWDSNDCDCKCIIEVQNCGALKTWDKETCRCKCKETKELQCCKARIDQQTCQCT